VKRALRAGPITVAYAGWVPLYLAALAGLGSLPFAASARAPLQGTAALAPLAPLYLWVLPALLLVQLGLAGAALFDLRRLGRGTRGRGRLLVLAGAGLVQPLATGGLALLLRQARFDALLAQGAGWQDPLTTVQFELPPPLGAVYLGVLALSALTLLTMLGAALASWFLLPARTRALAWVVADALIAVAFVYTTLAYPLRPSALSADLVQPATRLAVTTIFVIRLIARLIAPTLDVVERTGFHALVAARMLRAGKSGFLTAIGTLSILAVTVSSCALTTTLSVMGGFRQDLKRKILGNSAHVVVDRDHGTFEGWVPVVERARAGRDVLGASPYVSGEVMISSASNLSGAVLRGIDPDTVSQVTDLERNLRRGRMAYLRDPAQLVDLPPDQIDGALIPLQQPMFAPRDAGTPKRDDEAAGGRGPLGDLDAILADGADGGVPSRPQTAETMGDPREGTPGDPRDDGLRGGGLDLDDFLLPEEDIGPRKDVLPGIVVGQELARTLRLFVGDEVNVVSPLGGLGPSGPVPKSRAFRVAGIFYSGMYEYDMKSVYVTLPVAQDFLSTGDGISGVEIKVRDVERAPETAAALRRTIGRSDLRVRDWQETNRNLFGALALEKLAMFIALGIAIVVAGFCVFGTLTLMVQEKAREVGVLKAMGTTPAGIVAAFLLEGVLIGLFGSSIGLGAGYVACFTAEHFGVRMNPEVYYIDKLPVAVDGSEFGLVFVASVAVCTLATIFPAVLASRLRPVDALRFD
jgi:lipoprotein-releasing system permease protein